MDTLEEIMVTGSFYNFPANVAAWYDKGGNVRIVSEWREKGFYPTTVKTFDLDDVTNPDNWELVS